MSEMSLKDKARDLRNNATSQENQLYYQFLRSFKVRIHRQKVIGYYIVDFYCHKAKLVIEIDGGQHFQDKKMNQDDLRTAFLEKQGLLVLRFTNWEVDHQFAQVCQRIEEVVDQRIEELG
jgi:very-short-patch-repair endonuclease